MLSIHFTYWCAFWETILEWNLIEANEYICLLSDKRNQTRFFTFNLTTDVIFCLYPFYFICYPNFPLLTWIFDSDIILGTFVIKRKSWKHIILWDIFQKLKNIVIHDPIFFFKIISQKMGLKNWAAASCFRIEASAVQIEIALEKVRFTHLNKKPEKWNFFWVSDEMLKFMRKKTGILGMGSSCGDSVFWLSGNGKKVQKQGTMKA